MKNLKLRMKLCFLGIIFILFAVFCIYFLHHTMNRMQEKTIEYIGQELLASDEEMDTGEIRKDMEAFTSEREMLFLMISLVCAGVVIAFLIRVFYSTARAFGQTETALKKIAEGDFSVAPGGEASDMVEETRKNLGILYGEVKHAANGLTRSVEGISSMSAEVSVDISGISDNMEQMIFSLKEAVTVSEELSRLSAEIEESVQKIFSRAKDGLGWAKDIRERAEAARESAEEKRENLRKSKKGMKEGLSRELKDAGLAAQISALSDSVMKTLERINLLSLNASVEAAKAGIAGKEYAIVTDEIRILAEQSMKAVENIQWVSEEVVSAVHNLNDSTLQMMEFLDTDIYTACNYFVQMAESYIRDAGEMDFITSSFRTESEKQSERVESIRESIDQISKAAGCGEAGFADIADKMTRIASKTTCMMRDIRKAEHAARLLNKGMGQFHITEKEIE